MFKIIGSAEPKFLAVGDILIGDMSDTNYEFLLFNRPIILLNNEWLEKNFPTIGLRSDIENLSDAISACLFDEDHFLHDREDYLMKVYKEPYQDHSLSVLKEVVARSSFNKPLINLVDNNNKIYFENLIPLKIASKKLGYPVVRNAKSNQGNNQQINFFSHFNLVENFTGQNNFNIHIGHGLKGQGTANVEISVADYKKNNFFPQISLFIVAGNDGFKRTRTLLDGHIDRIVIAGYPKADNLIRANEPERRLSVRNELGIKDDKPLIIYAPAGERSVEKPGGSLDYDLIYRLREIESRSDFHILVKYKYKFFSTRARLSKIKKSLFSLIK